jgi:hypothetical protein
MKSEILNPELNTIVFTKRAKAVSDFDVETTYKKYKDFKYIEISNSILLTRFKVGVKRKEIPQFNLVVEDYDGKIYEDIVSIDGCLDKCWSSLIVSQNLYLTMELA